MSKPKAEAMKKNLRGVVCAMITPMNEDYSLDLDGMARNLDAAINDGVVNGRGGFIIGGSGGELAHMTIDERKQLIKTSVETVAVHRNTNTQLWANCETFSRCDSPTWRPVSFTGDMERIKYQLKVCSPPVDKVITWIYQGVWNRQSPLVNIGPPEGNYLYQHYVQYRNQHSTTSVA